MGRPRGAKNVTDIQTVILSRCKRCGSTERTKYGSPRIQEYAGILANGDRYTHIVRNRTRCLACGQARIDRSFENRITLPDDENEK